jgi:hypothetical protein
MIAVIAVLVMQSVAPVPAIGVANISFEGRICIAMAGPTLTPGASVTLVQPDIPRSVLVVTIDKSVRSCGLDGAVSPGPYYLAKRTSTSELGTLWVAFAGKLVTRRAVSGAAVVRISAAYPNAQVRSCTSREGVHLTVWSGTPLKSHRLSHQYYYLGYDVEPSCDERDYRDTAG